MKLIRKEEERQAKAKAEYERKYKLAQADALLHGFRMLERFVKLEEIPRAWAFQTPDKMWRKPRADANSFSRVSHWQVYETEGGTSDEFEHYGYHVRGVIQNGGGFDMAVLLQDNQRHRLELYAIGVSEGVLSLQGLPDALIPFYCPEVAHETEHAGDDSGRPEGAPVD
jgi:hypothetical protein